MQGDVHEVIQTKQTLLSEVLSEIAVMREVSDEHFMETVSILKLVKKI